MDVAGSKSFAAEHVRRLDKALLLLLNRLSYRVDILIEIIGQFLVSFSQMCHIVYLGYCLGYYLHAVG